MLLLLLLRPYSGRANMYVLTGISGEALCRTLSTYSQHQEQNGDQSPFENLALFCHSLFPVKIVKTLREDFPVPVAIGILNLFQRDYSVIWEQEKFFHVYHRFMANFYFFFFCLNSMYEYSHQQCFPPCCPLVAYAFGLKS